MEQEVSISDQPVLLQNNSRKLWESAKTNLGLTDLVDTSLDIKSSKVGRSGRECRSSIRGWRKLIKGESGFEDYGKREIILEPNQVFGKVFLSQAGEGRGKRSYLLDLGSRRVTFESRSAASASGMFSDDHCEVQHATAQTPSVLATTHRHKQADTGHTVLDPQMPNAVFKHRMARIISTPEGVGDVSVDADLPGGLAVEDDRFRNSAVRAYNQHIGTSRL